MEANAIAKGGIPTTKSGLPAYVEYTNKHGVTIKVANFKNPDICPDKGIVKYEAWKKQDFNRLRDTQFLCSVAKDKTTDILYGIFKGFDNQGNPQWQHFPLGMINVYDRSIPSEAQKACILAMSPMTEGSPNYFHKVGVFRLVDEEKAAIEKINKITVGKRALNIAEGLYGEELLSACWAMDINTDNISVTMMTATLLESVQSDPEKFIRAWEHPNREAINVLNKALNTRVIENDIAKGVYSYNGSVIGHNYDFAVKFLVDNPAIMAVINAKAVGKQADSIKAMEPIVKDSSVPNNSELEELKKRLAEAEAKNAELLLKSEIDATSGVKSASPLEQELEELKVQARKIGGNMAKGLKFFIATPESIAKLRDKIQSAKK